MKRLGVVIIVGILFAVMLAAAGGNLPAQADSRLSTSDLVRPGSSDPGQQAGTGDRLTSNLEPQRLASRNRLQSTACAGHTGKLTLLRVHDVGTGYGPPTAFLDVEVVIRLNTEPDKAFGFQLRDDGNRLVRRGMVDLLRDAFDNNWTVDIDECDGVIFRVWLTKP